MFIMQHLHIDFSALLKMFFICFSNLLKTHLCYFRIAEAGLHAPSDETRCSARWHFFFSFDTFIPDTNGF